MERGHTDLVLLGLAHGHRILVWPRWWWLVGGTGDGLRELDVNIDFRLLGMEN